ncbi:MAG: hypothetical protein Tsb005_08100 [Gammaproteobacteria bacterium]
MPNSDVFVKLIDDQNIPVFFRGPNPNGTAAWSSALRNSVKNEVCLKNNPGYLVAVLVNYWQQITENMSDSSHAHANFSVNGNNFISYIQCNKFARGMGRAGVYIERIEPLAEKHYQITFSVNNQTTVLELSFKEIEASVKQVMVNNYFDLAAIKYLVGTNKDIEIGARQVYDYKNPEVLDEIFLVEQFEHKYTNPQQLKLCLQQTSAHLSSKIDFIEYENHHLQAAIKKLTQTQPLQSVQLSTLIKLDKTQQQLLSEIEEIIAAYQRLLQQADSYQQQLNFNNKLLQLTYPVREQIKVPIEQLSDDEGRALLRDQQRILQAWEQLEEEQACTATFNTTENISRVLELLEFLYRQYCTHVEQLVAILPDSDVEIGKHSHARNASSSVFE